MIPSDIKEGQDYIGKDNKVYTVNQIEKKKSYKLVRFIRHAPFDGIGTWKIEEFANHMKEVRK